MLIFLAPKLGFFVDAHITMIPPSKCLIAVRSTDSKGISHFQKSINNHTKYPKIILVGDGREGGWERNDRWLFKRAVRVSTTMSP